MGPENQAEYTIRAGSGRTAKLLPIGGKDSRGNIYQVDNISLLKNGRRFLPVMGEFHFSRYEPEDWKEELLKMRAGGVDIVAAYVLWIHHEEKEGEWDFNGCRNLRAFLEVCRRIDMPVWLRIGPWAHGECRNGGFPDWVVKGNFKTRTNDPVYLSLVKKWYDKLGEQAEGMMCKDGGPVIGLQLENEYGHCGGPSDREEGMEHLRTLKKLAIDAGFDVPYYTATGWGGAYVVDGEMLPVLGGYVDAPWAEHVQEMPASANFVFSAYKQDENIGSDLRRAESPEFTFDIHINPYLTAELGGGLQVTSHRRPCPAPVDIEAQALCMLGGGANLLGYYMYHGGINPDGKYTTLQESRATGYNNDLPVKSYDFQTCIRQSGEVGESFGRLKRLHLLLEDFGELLAGADAIFPETVPESPEDCRTLRFTVRLNREAGVGFLFLNNHQRRRRMEAHRNFNVRLVLEDGTVGAGSQDAPAARGGLGAVLPDLTVEDGDCGIIPFRLPGRDGESGSGLEALPVSTNAFLLCRLGKRGFYYTDLEKADFVWGQEQGDAVVLTGEEAARAFRMDGKLYIIQRTDSCLIEEEGQAYLITKAEEECLTVYGPCGAPEKRTAKAEPVHVGAAAALLREAFAADGSLDYREYLVTVDPVPADGFHQLYLDVDYVGDRAEVYLDGRLADDWFTTGAGWHLALKRFGYPEKLVLRIYPSDKPIPNPYGNQVYYDLPVKKGCELLGVKTLTEYKIAVEK